ncbi:DUF2960 family protein [Catenovulum sediminis]|uniref:DUF2960 family protein n=1 Tax=Catenovulum sediminis TaxID=1740262 RepID=A0ABV1RF26_9ALTE|nr:DUF2960 family protein [Catenovulum sediminis]
MARKIIYVYKQKRKEINFSYDKHIDAYEAAAAAEGIDLTDFLQMEEQVRISAKSNAAVKNFREESFKKMGFGEIRWEKIEAEK